MSKRKLGSILDEMWAALLLLGGFILFVAFIGLIGDIEGWWKVLLAGLAVWAADWVLGWLGGTYERMGLTAPPLTAEQREQAEQKAREQKVARDAAAREQESALERELRTYSSGAWIAKAKWLADYGDSSAVPALLRCEFQSDPGYYGDNDDWCDRSREIRDAEPGLVRAASGPAIRKIRERTATDELRKLLGNPRLEIREWAAKGLHERGWKPETLEERVRFGMFHDAGELDGAAVLPVLLRELDSAAAAVRSRIAYSLATLGGPDVVAPISKLLKDQRTRQSAAAALQKTGDPIYLEPLLEAAELEAIVPVNRQAVGYESICEVTRKEHTLQYIVDGLAAMPRAAVADRLLQAAQQAADPLARHVAAVALARLGDLRAAEPLLAVLRCDFPALRTLAIEAVSTCKDPRAVDALLEIAAHSRGHDYSDEARAFVAAAKVLTALEEPRAAAVLAEVVTQSYGSVKNAAIEAVAKLKDPVAIAPLLQTALGHGDAYTRNSAAEALREIGYDLSPAELAQVKAGPQPVAAVSPSKPVPPLGGPKLTPAEILAAHAHTVPIAAKAPQPAGSSLVKPTTAIDSAAPAGSRTKQTPAEILATLRAAGPPRR